MDHPRKLRLLVGNGPSDSSTILVTSLLILLVSLVVLVRIGGLVGELHPIVGIDIARIVED